MATDRKIYSQAEAAAHFGLSEPALRPYLRKLNLNRAKMGTRRKMILGPIQMGMLGVEIDKMRETPRGKAWQRRKAAE